LFVRPGELRKADWSEFDLDGAHPQWRIPAARMKLREQHIVPLAKQAVAILRELQPLTGPTGLVFPGLRSLARPMSENTLNAALRRLGYDKETVTAHGFRSLASSILNEQHWHKTRSSGSWHMASGTRSGRRTTMRTVCRSEGR
jgi:integrase